MSVQQIIPPNHNCIEYPFAHYASSRQPLLQQAVKEQVSAHSVKVEWLLDTSQTGDREIWENYTQIIRTPFTPINGDRELYLALEKHLDDVEKVLWFGTPSYEVSGAHPFSTCGGVLHYLNRAPLYADRIILRPLRDLVLLKDRHEVRTVHEFLSEVSLQVIPAPSIPRRV